MGGIESNPIRDCFRNSDKKKNTKNDVITETPYGKSNADKYFTKEDIIEIRKKYPDYDKWSRISTIELKESRPKPKKIKWKISNVIGVGSFGRVYFGLNTETGQLMAVKQVDIGHNSNASTQEQIKALELEIDILSLFSHKNIVRYIGSSRTKTTFNIFLEYVTGGHTIASLLEKYGKFNENLIRVYTKQIIEGLEYLHVRNTIHRDIKGSNILVDNDGVCKLADFGTAKKISMLIDKSMANSIRGTVYWMAPEVIRQKSLGRQSDIWSLGCTVIEMATGKPPWSTALKSRDQLANMYQIVKSKSAPPIPTELSPEGQDFLRRCLKVDAKERPNCTQLRNHKFLQDNEPIYMGIVDTSSLGTELFSPNNPGLAALRSIKIPLKGQNSDGNISQRISKPTFQLSSKSRNSADDINVTPKNKQSELFLNSLIKSNAKKPEKGDLKDTVFILDESEKRLKNDTKDMKKSIFFKPPKNNDIKKSKHEVTSQNILYESDKESDLSSASLNPKFKDQSNIGIKEQAELEDRKKDNNASVEINSVEILPKIDSEDKSLLKRISSKKSEHYEEQKQEPLPKSTEISLIEHNQTKVENDDKSCQKIMKKQMSLPNNIFTKPNQKIDDDKSLPRKSSCIPLPIKHEIHLEYEKQKTIGNTTEQNTISRSTTHTIHTMQTNRDAKGISSNDFHIPSGINFIKPLTENPEANFEDVKYDDTLDGLKGIVISLVKDSDQENNTNNNNPNNNVDSNSIKNELDSSSHDNNTSVEVVKNLSIQIHEDDKSHIEKESEHENKVLEDDKDIDKNIEIAMINDNKASKVSDQDMNNQIENEHLSPIKLPNPEYENLSGSNNKYKKKSHVKKFLTSLLDERKDSDDSELKNVILENKAKIYKQNTAHNQRLTPSSSHTDNLARNINNINNTHFSDIAHSISVDDDGKDLDFIQKHKVIIKAV